MGTSLVKFSTAENTSPRWGVKKDTAVHTLALDNDHHADLMDIYFNDRAAFDGAISPDSVDVANVTFHNPINPRVQLIAQGLNYADHRAEGGLDTDAEEDENLIFMKAASSLCDPNETILRPKGCELLDYEIELTIVLKRDVHEAVQVTDANLGDYIGGLILMNDVSARDIMFGAPMLQWYRGKSQKTFCPSGPVLYLLDEGDISKLYDLELILKWNGETRQNATTDLLIHRPPKTITELSEFMSMNAGDCILTGTPGGVIANTNLKSAMAILLNFTNEKKRRAKFVKAQKALSPYMQPGDTLELEIKSKDGSIDLGRQNNVIGEA